MRRVECDAGNHVDELRGRDGGTEMEVKQARGTEIEVKLEGSRERRE